jgi:hypothetical protein
MNASSDLQSFEEVVPAAARLGAPSRSSILTQRRRCRVTPQTGMNYGSAGAGGANSQLQFLVADQGGLIDMRSVCVNYTIQTAGGSGTVCPEDGHPFTTVQVLLNGSLLDNIQNAMKLTNIEMKMGGSRAYYQGAGSLQGFELLNPDLAIGTTLTVSGANAQTLTAPPAWGYVLGNTTDLAGRAQRAGAAMTNQYAGEPRSIPLGLMSGVGRIAQYLPISLLGELQLVLITGSNGEVTFDATSNTAGTYSLANVSLEYDIVVPSTPYMSLLQHIAAEDSPTGGLNMPFESSIITAGASIAASASTLTENTVIVSRATNHLLRTSVVQIPTALLQSPNYPAQSCFSHAGTWAVQFRVGSQTFPQVAAQGDASTFNMSLAAYGSVEQQAATVINRALWSQSTNGTTAGTAATYETAQVSSGGGTKFVFADSFIPSYGFRTVKGGAEPLDVDGISLAGASGSQLICTIVSAPAAAYTPFVSLVALKFIKAKGGAVSVIGA